MARTDPPRRAALEQGLREDRIQKRHAHRGLPEGRSRIRSRQPEILLHPLRPGRRGQRHGTLVGRPPLGRDHQRLGADVQRRGEAGRQLAFRADRTGRRARARQGAARRRIPGVAGVHPRPRGGTLPRTDAQHGRIERLPRGFAPQRIVHAAARHDPLDHGLRAFQLRGPAGRQGRETHPAGPRTL